MATELKVPPVSTPQVQPRPQAKVQRSALFSGRLIAALGSGALMWACYFPLGWGWLAWVALVPLLGLVRAEERPRKIYFAAWVGGLAFFLPSLYWMSVADYRMVYAWIALAMYCALYWVAGIFLLRRLERATKLPLVITVPVVWTALEFLRSFLISGFAWYFLGHSQHAYLAVIQIADITGVYGISFLIAAANAWLFEGLYRVAWFRGLFRPGRTELCPAAGWGRTAWGIAIVAALIVTCGYGLWRLEQTEFQAGPRIALLQGNIDQRLRNRAAADLEAQLDMGRHYARLEELARPQNPDLIIWPETSYPGEWFDVVGMPVPLRLKIWQDEKLEPVRNSKVAQLLGMNSKILDQDKRPTLYNSAILVTAAGDYSQRYDKIHRVPFGEYVPLRHLLPFLKNFSPYDYDYSISAGDKYTRFALDKYRFGVLICFEDTDPVLARQYHADGPHGPAVDFLVNISNDGWFDGTSEHEEHLAISRFRAIECRRALVRSVNMGVSAVIDGNGRVQAPQLVSQDPAGKNWVIKPRDGRVPDLSEGQWGDFKKVAGAIIATVPLDRRSSFYAQWGDWLPWSCWLVVGVALAWVLLRPGRTRPVALTSGAAVVGPVRVVAGLGSDGKP